MGGRAEADDAGVRAARTRIVGVPTEARRPLTLGGFLALRYVLLTFAVIDAVFSVALGLVGLGMAAFLLLVAAIGVVSYRGYMMGIDATAQHLVVRNTFRTIRIPWGDINGVDDDLGFVRIHTNTGDVVPDVGRPRAAIDAIHERPFARIVTRINNEVAKHTGLSNAS